MRLSGTVPRSVRKTRFNAINGSINIFLYVCVLSFTHRETERERERERERAGQLGYYRCCASQSHGTFCKKKIYELGQQRQRKHCGLITVFIPSVSLLNRLFYLWKITVIILYVPVFGILTIVIICTQPFLTLHCHQNIYKKVNKCMTDNCIDFHPNKLTFISNLKSFSNLL